MRHEYYLDREWRFLPGDGMTEAQKTHSDSYNSSKAGGERGIPSMSFDDSEWRMLNLPHDYLTETEFAKENLISHGYKTRHNAWYRKSFRLPAEFDGKHIFLSFEGIAVTARVYLNGSLMGRSFSAYAPLDIDITDRAFFGERVNTLVVYVDGLTTEGWWYEGAGIYRHVKLFVKEPLHIAHDGLWIKPVLRDNGNWDVVCEATAENSAYKPQSFSIRTQLFDGETCIAEGVSDTFTCPADEKKAVSHVLSVQNPTLWDVDNPKLYTARVTLYSGETVLDEDTTRIGFRTFTADKDKGFFLNGKPIKLKGTCNHQDHAGVGVAVPDAIQYYRIRRLKDMGTNAYRCAHNMPSKAILDACDELGMLVMDENRRFESRPEVLGHVESMIRRDRNHPSVVFWSLFNEEPLQGTHEGGNIYRRMRSLVRKLDDTRLLTGAMNGGYGDDDSAAAAMDVTGINYNVPNGPIQYHKAYPDRPVVGSENNSAVTTRGCYKTDASQNVLACYDEERVPWGQLIKETWKFTRETEWFGGIFIWTGFDYRGEPTPYQWPSIGSFFGIMDTCGFAKDSFYQNRACFVDEPMLHILPHWNWNEGDVVRVMTASNCEEVELFLNGISLGRKPSDCVAPAEWQVAFVPGTLSAVGYRNGEAVVQAQNVTAGAPARIVIEPDRTTLNNDGMDAMPVNFSVVDKDGNPCETADNLIRLTLSGDAVLLGVGNGGPNCLESDHKPERSLFAGHMQAVIGSVPGGSAFTLKAEADGLESAEITISCNKVPAPEYLYAATRRMLTGVTVTSAVFDEEPDACVTIADNDMNSLEPVSFDQWNIKPGFTKGWKFFRAIFTAPVSSAPDKKNICRLSVPALYAECVKCYINGTLIGEQKNCAGKAEVSFPCEQGKKYELRLLLKAKDGEPCGIRSGIRMELE